MSDSLKDQLCALGLAPKQTGPKRNKPHKAGRNASRKTAGGKSGSAELSLDQAYRIRNRLEQQQKQQAIALKREQERRRREINLKIQALLKENAVRDEAAETKRNFLYKGRIRSVLTTSDQLRELNEGKLGVVYLGGNYHLMPSEKVEEVRRFAPDHVPDLSGADCEGDEEHPVPDDLNW